MFASLLVRYLPFTCMMFLWAMIPSYSRMYLGVHYPGDILCGAVAGSVVGVLVYLLYARLRKKFFDCPQYISTQYTKGGYTKDDISILHATLLLTYLYAIIGGMIVAKGLHFLKPESKDIFEKKQLESLCCHNLLLYLNRY